MEKYSDSDLAGDKKIQKSIFDFIFIFNRELVSWYLKKQAIIALSSTEAKYIALTLVAKEVIWLHLLLTKLSLLQPDQ